jgi:uncharacterized membrane protein YccC
MAAGASLATVAGYLVTCYVYPGIDGFPLLCVALAPLLAFGAFLAMRPGTSGYGVGFCVFFCLLAGPDNVIVYAPDLLINNGVASVVGMLVSCLVFIVIFPTQMPWRIEKTKRDLRRQVVLLIKRSAQHRNALRWMLVTLDVGHSTIDLRNETLEAPYAERLQPGWHASLDAVRRDLADLFEYPETGRLMRALTSVDAAIRISQSLRDSLRENPERRHQMQRILSYLHFIRTTLLDRDAPFYAN